MAVRKYIYTFNGQPFSLELDLGDPEGTDVINLGRLETKQMYLSQMKKGILMIYGLKIS
jgi:hypothetical protein